MVFLKSRSSFSHFLFTTNVTDPGGLRRLSRQLIRSDPQVPLRSLTTGPLTRTCYIGFPRSYNSCTFLASFLRIFTRDIHSSLISPGRHRRFSIVALRIPECRLNSMCKWHNSCKTDKNLSARRQVTCATSRMRLPLRFSLRQTSFLSAFTYSWALTDRGILTRLHRPDLAIINTYPDDGNRSDICTVKNSKNFLGLIFLRNFITWRHDHLFTFYENDNVYLSNDINNPNAGNLFISFSFYFATPRNALSTLYV